MSNLKFTTLYFGSCPIDDPFASWLGSPISRVLWTRAASVELNLQPSILGHALKRFGVTCHLLVGGCHGDVRGMCVCLCPVGYDYACVLRVCVGEGTYRYILDYK